MKLSNIKPNPSNPRIIKTEKFKKLVNSLKEFPEMMEKRPMVCVTDVDGKIYPLGGNMRLRALQELGYKEIPDNWVVMADDWTEEKRREFIIKDNLSYGEWDWDILANEWQIDELKEYGVDVPNWDENQNIDIDIVDEFNESVNFIIKCKDLNQLEELKNKLNTNATKLSYEEFLIKAGL